jgi:hypothetical protein
MDFPEDVLLACKIIPSASRPIGSPAAQHREVMSRGSNNKIATFNIEFESWSNK